MIERFGFSRNPIEPCHMMMYHSESKCLVNMLFHVDNIMIGTNQKEYITYLIQSVKKNFKLTYANAESILGVSVQFELLRKRCTFNQVLYILTLVEKYNPPLTPVQKNPMRSATESKYNRRDMGDAPKSTKPYLNLLMALYWVGRSTRSEILSTCVFFAYFSTVE